MYSKDDILARITSDRKLTMNVYVITYQTMLCHGVNSKKYLDAFNRTTAMIKDYNNLVVRFINQYPSSEVFPEPINESMIEPGIQQYIPKI
jgi:hypothetical protein